MTKALRAFLPLLGERAGVRAVVNTNAFRFISSVEMRGNFILLPAQNPTHARRISFAATQPTNTSPERMIQLYLLP